MSLSTVFGSYCITVVIGKCFAFLQLTSILMLSIRVSVLSITYNLYVRKLSTSVLTFLTREQFARSSPLLRQSCSAEERYSDASFQTGSV